MAVPVDITEVNVAIAAKQQRTVQKVIEEHILKANIEKKA